MKQNFLIFLDFTRKLLANRYMISSMAKRELRSRYMGSAFGLAWAIIDPVAQLVIYGVVFGVLLKSRPDPVYGTDSFFLYLFCGLIPWQFFSLTVNSMLNLIETNKSLIKKAVGFPSEVLPIVTVTSNAITHFIGVALLLAALLIFTGKLTLLTPFILIYLFFTGVFAVGLGWILSSATVYLKDLKQVWSLIMLGWFFFTPVFWSAGNMGPNATVILKINPMYHVVDGYRRLLLLGRMPDIADLSYFAAISVITFAIGGVFFRKLKSGFMEVV